MIKRRSFEYLLSKLHSWYAENASIESNDLSVLKSLKLLFLITAADIELSQRKGTIESEDLLIHTTFDRFYALPLGHVESGIYEWIRETKGHLTAFTINRMKLTAHSNYQLNTTGVSTESIDNAIDFLKIHFPNLITMKAYELVELTHKWSSWKFFYNSNSKVSLIPSDVIIEEPKHFS